MCNALNEIISRKRILNSNIPTPKKEILTYNSAYEMVVPLGQRIYDPNVFGRYDLASQRIIPINESTDGLADMDIILERTQRLDTEPHLTQRNRYTVLLNEIPHGEGICLDACTNMPLEYVRKTIEDKGYSYTPIDLNPGPDVQKEDLTRLSFSSNSIDLIISSDTLEHIKEFDVAISEIYRVLKPHRLAIIHIPCYYFEKFQSEPIEKEIDPFGHVWYFSARSIIDMLSKTGFIIMRVTFLFDYGALLCVVQKPE